MGINIKNTIKGIIRFIKTKNVIAVPVPVDTEKILQGKVALITGGSSGIGYAIAKSFINSGCKVILVGRNEQKLIQCRHTLGEENAQCIVLDLKDTALIPEKVAEAGKLFGQGRIDILVNSAGVAAQNSFRGISEKEYDNIMDINAKAAFFMCQAVAEYMIERKIKGHILNVSSSSALRPAWTPYQMSKWAVRGFTIGLADLLLPYGIIVNAIAPGMTATPMSGFDGEEEKSIYFEKSPAKRYVMPEEIANLAVFMVSDMGNMIVGDTFYMTGGEGVISMHN